MEIVQILKSLIRRKGLVAVAAAVALVAAIGVGLMGESSKGGTASAEILVDAQESTLGDLRRETVPLVARSDIFARFLGAGGATAAIARQANVPEADLVVVGPPLNINGVPDQAAAELATERADDARFLVQIQRGDELPLLSIFTEAPETNEARRLADGTAVALEDFVTEYQKRATIPVERRVTIRPLGSTQVGSFETGPSPLVPLVVFVAVFGLLCAGILAWPSIVAAWKSQDPEVEPPAADWPGRAGNGDSGLHAGHSEASFLRRNRARMKLRTAKGAEPRSGSDADAGASEDAATPPAKITSSG